jgi:hypothetical protein
MVAADSEDKGMFEDSVKLYDLAGNHEKVVELLCKLLAQVSKPKGPLFYSLNIHFKGLFTRKSDFALSLQAYKTNKMFLFPEMNKLIAKSCSEIGRVNKTK